MLAKGKKKKESIARKQVTPSKSIFKREADITRQLEQDISGSEVDMRLIHRICSSTCATGNDPFRPIVLCITGGSPHCFPRDPQCTNDRG